VCVDLLRMNKEGVCSLAGYVALWFFGVTIGRQLHGNRASLSSFRSLCTALLSADVVLWLLFVATAHYIEPSRRMVPPSSPSSSGAVCSYSSV
jgi:uncharacterized membrane protein